VATAKVKTWLRPSKAQRRRLRLWRRQVAIFLAVIGPGLITSNVDNDAGGIYTYSLAGAQFGYLLLWTLIPMTLILFVTEEMAARMGVVTGKGLSDLIREEFGFRITFFLMLAVLAVAMGNILAEFAGVAASLELFGISRYFSVPAAALLVWWLVVRGTSKSVERIFLAICVFYLAYVFSAILAKPDWITAAYHTVPWPVIDWRSNYLLLVLALVGSTIAPWQHFYLQSAVVEKGIPRERYWETRADVLVGSITCMVIVFFIIVCCAATLHAAGETNISNAAQAAEALRPLAGPYASALFALGLLNASLFAASILPLSTAFVICEGLGVEAGVDKSFREAPFFYWLYTALIVVGAGLILLPGTPLVRIMVLSQAVNSFLLPAVLIFMLKLVNRSDLMGEWRNSALFNVVAWGTAVVMILLTAILIYLGLTGVDVSLSPKAG
jgi:NRAMP (natural resistance-associated macrophage protein)-like metal ion transporter